VGRRPAVSTCCRDVFFSRRPGNAFLAADRSAKRFGFGSSPVITSGRLGIHSERPYRCKAISDTRRFGRREQNRSMGLGSQFSE
jgi:hypothetical protein